MTKRRLRGALLAIALIVTLIPAPVQATGVPSPANSTTPACVTLVGSDGNLTASPVGEFSVIFRDLANNPVPNLLIDVDFSLVPELFIAAHQPDPALLVDCAGKKVSKRTDVNGRADFCIVGASTDAFPPSTLLGGCRIYAGGTLIASPTASAFDLDGRDGVGAGDLFEFLNDFVTGLNYGRSDFDCSGSIGAGDLALWLRAFASGTQLVSAAVACP